MRGMRIAKMYKKKLLKIQYHSSLWRNKSKPERQSLHTHVDGYYQGDKR